MVYKEPTREEMLCALEKRHGKELQSRFTTATVTICGLGGIGSNVAIALARAGVGQLHLIDYDKVDLSNLNRQQYKVVQLGQYKTEALKENLREIAPYVKVTTDRVKITEENADELLRGSAIICEAFDRAEEKAMLVNYVLEHFKETPLVAASGMAGLCSSNSIKTRQVAKQFYLCGDEVHGIEDGSSLIASRVMLCAAHQANMILRLIAGMTNVEE